MAQVQSVNHKATLGLVLLVGAAFMAALPGARASDSITYVESVDCVAGVCTARLRTEPVMRTVRERHAGNMCVEFTRSIAGMKKVPTVDPNTPIQLPQYQDSPSRFVRCDQKAADGNGGNLLHAGLDSRRR